MTFPNPDLSVHARTLRDLAQRSDGRLKPRITKADLTDALLEIADQLDALERPIVMQWVCDDCGEYFAERPLAHNHIIQDGSAMTAGVRTGRLRRLLAQPIMVTRAER